MKVKKRDMRIVDFDKNKIKNAILKAMNEVDNVDNNVANRIANEISKLEKEELSVEEIQDLTEEKLMNSRMKDVARAYIRYRYDREKNRILSNNLQNHISILFYLIIIFISKQFLLCPSLSNTVRRCPLSSTVLYLIFQIHSQISQKFRYRN